MKEKNRAPHPDNELMNRIRGNTEVLGQVYLEHRDYCLNFLRRMGGKDEGILSGIVCDAVIVLYEKAGKEGFVLTCSIGTFLVSVCRNQLLNWLKNEGLDIPMEKSQPEPDYDQEGASPLKPDPGIIDLLEEEQGPEEELMSKLLTALSLMKASGGICYEILKRVYFENQRMDQIAYEMDYSNPVSARNQKHKCMKRLKKLCDGKP